MNEHRPDWDHVYDLLLNASKDAVQVEETFEQLREIDRLRTEKDAVILAHYYQMAPIQAIADFRGDSLNLAMQARDLGHGRLVVSATVHFMAEMIQLLSPRRKVIIPSLEASCSIAEGVNGAMVGRMKEAFPEATVVSYINTTAETKAAVDVVCTSANAREIVRRAPGRQVLLIPDFYFAINIIREIDDDREILAYKETADGQMVFWDPRRDVTRRVPAGDGPRPPLNKGICVVHETFTPYDVEFFRRSQGVDLVLAHPEVKPEVAALADMVGGTGKMLDYVGRTEAKNILFITECDLAAPLIEAYPDRNFITPCKLCPYMKKITIPGLLESLRGEFHEIIVPPELAPGARLSLDRMFEWMRRPS